MGIFPKIKVWKYFQGLKRDINGKKNAVLLLYMILHLYTTPSSKGKKCSRKLKFQFNKYELALKILVTPKAFDFLHLIYSVVFVRLRFSKWIYLFGKGWLSY